MALLLLIFGLLASRTWAEEIPPKDCEAMVAKYGKLEVASIAHAGRQGIITVEVNGQLVEKLGSQDPQYITPRSVCADLEKNHVPLEKIPELIHQQQTMIKQAAEQKAEIERRREAAQEQGARQETERAATERQQVSNLESEPGCKDEATARVRAKEFVTKSLKAPATAEFPWFWHDQYRYLGNCRHQISSYVDAQNSFGAKLRNYYVVVVRFAGGDRWTLDDIKFSH